ncbi:MAG: DUF1028 domain-containing protein [Rhodospirillaceae bacterium]|nr:DUF1028 domain-containing protein [Rhodospirillaceae bacterium]MBT4491204.1 DUF1028 domain-containing protein [Rhodospirillaceae bacterium]MBT5897318.1 DUF1028 domain-containing protein [Rhodospirillaceae bacterium]MBT6427442.1 DUF1028 domain-containing protein [Rhodospirillaceae bacterium]MBT7759067.1 DUF1028 domain-containing protein [Rhodospirillaceae bacterium]
MTFSILGHCRDSGQIGLALTSVTMGVGGISPCYGYGGDIVVVQAKGNPRAAIAGVRSLDAGHSLEDTLHAVIAADNHVEYRQIAIMRRDGAMIARTGRDNQPWAGEKEGRDCLAFGNVLKGPEVVAAMADAFDGSAGAALAARLITALEAGRDAGGQRSADGRHFSERGAAVKVIGAPELPEVPLLDLRVDLKFDAVSELRRVYEVYEPMIALRALRAAHPDRTPVLWDWEHENMSAKPPPDMFYED